MRGPLACRKEASALFFSCTHLERGVLGVGMSGAWGILITSEGCVYSYIVRFRGFSCLKASDYICQEMD